MREARGWGSCGAQSDCTPFGVVDIRVRGIWSGRRVVHLARSDVRVVVVEHRCRRYRLLRRPRRRRHHRRSDGAARNGGALRGNPTLEAMRLDANVPQCARARSVLEVYKCVSVSTTVCPYAVRCVCLFVFDVAAVVML